MIVGLVHSIEYLELMNWLISYEGYLSMDQYPPPCVTIGASYRLI